MSERIGILFAMEEEEADFRRVLSESKAFHSKLCGGTLWRIGSVELAVTVGGIGRQNSTKATAQLIDCGATGIVCAGLSAGLDPSAQVGDLFLADTICLSDQPRSGLMRASSLLMSMLPPKGPKGAQIRRCSAVTVDRVIISAEEKMSIFRQTGASVLDMESYAAAEVCARRDIPFASLRCVSDRSDQNLPKEILSLLDMRNTVSRALYVMTRPKLWLPLARLRKQAASASEILADTLGMMVLRLV